MRMNRQNARIMAPPGRGPDSGLDPSLGVKRAARRKCTPEEKVRIVLEGFRGEIGISALCRRVRMELKAR